MRSATIRLCALLSATFLASACGIMPGGGGDGGGDASGSGTLRVACFGNDQRVKRIETAAKAFEQSGGVKVQLECTGFANYFDKLATQFAAKDAPDVVMLTDQFLGEYADRGAVKNLGDSVDTGKFDDLSAAEGTTSKGRFGVAAGLNTMTILANPDMLKAAKVSLPDDKTWTWDQYADLAAKITKNGKKKTYGSDAPNFGGAFELWLRQHGKSSYTDQGGLGFDAAAVEDYLEFVQGLGKRRAIPPASVVTEQTKALEQSGVATNKSAMGWFWNSAAPAINKASGSDIAVLRPPSTSGSSSEAEFYLKPDSLWSVNSGAKDTDQATKFVDFMVNDSKAGDALLTSLGVPPNSDVRDAIADKVKGVDKETFDYVQEIEGELGDKRAAIPAGGGVLDKTMSRYALDVLFDRQTPKAAAKEFVEKMTTAIKE